MLVLQLLLQSKAALTQKLALMWGKSATEAL